MEQTLKWRRLFSRPFLRSHGTAVTTPDVLKWHDELVIYVGVVEEGHEHIVTFPFPASLRPFQISSNAPVVVRGDRGGIENWHCFDPAAVVVDNEVHLYYSIVGRGQDQIGLALSADGYGFHEEQDLNMVGRAPEIVWWHGRFYLFFVLPDHPYAISLAVSDDGRRFQSAFAAPVLSAASGWDGFEVTTPRLFQRHGVFYMLYAATGDAARIDKPDAFGLARSTDLLHWERYPGNPVFTMGAPGEWDDGALWFGTVFEWQDALYLMYEGGTVDAIEQSPALTQVGLAKVESAVFDRCVTDWG